MARKPKAEKQVSVAKRLQDALKFCSVASRDIGLPYQSHFQFINKHVVAFDGTICAAHPIDEDLHCCPNAAQFTAAINHVTTDLSMTESPDRDRITIRAGKLEANIPCIYATDYPFFAPDPSIAPIGDSFRHALSAVGELVTEGGAEIINIGILMRANTVVSTNRHLLFEAWHGWNVPTLCVPKALATALEKIDKELVSFGFTETSLTLYFKDGAWLRAQLYELKPYPDVDKILAQFPAEYTKLPEEFFKACEVMLGQNAEDEHAIDLEPTFMETPSGNAKYLINLTPYFATYARANAKYLLKCKWASGWNAENTQQFFFVSNGELAMRGTMMALVAPSKGKYNAPQSTNPARISDARYAELTSRPFETLTQAERDELVPF